MRRVILTAAIVAAASFHSPSAQAQNLDEILGRILGGQGQQQDQRGRRGYDERMEVRERLEMLEDADRRLEREQERIERDRRRIRQEMRRLEGRG